MCNDESPAYDADAMTELTEAATSASAPAAIDLRLLPDEVAGC